MRRRHSLRLRVAIAFAAFGAVVSLVLASGLFLAAHDVSRRLIDETLHAEVEDYMARRTRNPHSLPPSSLTLRGYVVGGDEAGEEIPPAVRSLPAGWREIRLDGVPYRVVVMQREGDRFFLMFNETQQVTREIRFLYYLIAGALAMTVLSAVGGLWLAGRVIAPVTELAQRVRSADPHQPAQLADAEAPADEVGELAGVFDQYLARLRAFIERERAFVADVSHELRTPLAVIQGASEVLQEDARLDEGQCQRVTRIERAAAEMTELIRSLLLLAREEEADRPSEADCDAAGVLHDCVERSRHLLGSRGTTVEVDIGAHPHLAAEPALFAVVVGNLIRNAFAYTETGRVTIRLESSRLVVSDTGIGIKAEEIGRVFQRYYKGAASTGSGIGLSLTKRICDRYGWTLAIESREAQGTSARLEFGPAAS